MLPFHKNIVSVFNTIEESLDGLSAAEIDDAIALVRGYSRIVICSMGKPAFACAKAAYTARSYGLDWVELDSTHAFHGDIGIVKDGDLIIVVSKSGKTKETNDVTLELISRGLTCLAITSNIDSELSQICRYRLIVPLSDECSPFGHAPMASTTLYMIILHALMCEAVSSNGCTIDQYAMNHPSGEIGCKLRKESS